MHVKNEVNAKKVFILPPIYCLVGYACMGNLVELEIPQVIPFFGVSGLGLSPMFLTHT